MLYFIFGVIALIVGGLIFVAIVYHMIQLVVGLAANCNWCRDFCLFSPTRISIQSHI